MRHRTKLRLSGSSNVLARPGVVRRPVAGQARNGFENRKHDRLQRRRWTAKAKFLTVMRQDRRHLQQVGALARVQLPVLNQAENRFQKPLGGVRGNAGNCWACRARTVCSQVVWQVNLAWLGRGGLGRGWADRGGNRRRMAVMGRIKRMRIVVWGDGVERTTGWKEEGGRFVTYYGAVLARHIMQVATTDY